MNLGALNLGALNLGALNLGAPRHAFATKDQVHRAERRRGDVGVKPGTGFNLGKW